MHKSVCFHEFLWICEKPVTDENGIYSSAEQPYAMEPGGSVTISSPWSECTELLSNTQECIPILAHRHPSHYIFHVYPSSSTRFHQSMQAVSDANPCAETGPYRLKEPVL